MDRELYREQGPKEVIRGKTAVCSSSHPIVTDTMIEVMKSGGNAVDAAVAGSLLQPVVEPHMTSHAGSISFLYWESATGKAYQLNSMGTLVPGLAPFRPLPSGLGGFVLPPPAVPPCACIPGFMPGLQAMYECFGTKPWGELCGPAIQWAEEGHPVSSFEYSVLIEELYPNAYFPSSREFFLPDGFTPRVGERYKMPELASTMRQLAQEGPAYFIEGDWAKRFVEQGNRLGWPVEMEHMMAIPPRWQEPLRYEHNGHVLVQLAPPETVGVYTAFVLGVLEALDLKSLGHYTESPECLYYMAHTLRRVASELALLHDPEVFDVPLDVWLSESYHQAVAEVLRHSRPKIDLTEHIRLTSGNPAMVAAGLPTAPSNALQPPSGSCELSIVDAKGNWLQVLNTVQTGGIPGIVLDGVRMWGSHAHASLAAGLAGWLVGGGRIRSILGSSLVLKNGRPWLGLGTPGAPTLWIPQVLWSILDLGMDPYEASVLPRMRPLRDDYFVEIESRVPESVVAGLAKMGVQVKPLPTYDYNMGSFQICWRDESTGLLNSSADPRRAGKASGF